MSQSQSGKISAAMFALVMALVATLVAFFLLIQSFFPWMTVFNPSAGAAPAKVKDVTRPTNVTNGGPTPAEVALKAVMGSDIAAVRDGGWVPRPAAKGVPGVSFGFACDPTDGLAPVVAEGRSWTRDDSTLTVSARAYPAGGGAVALQGLTEAVARCSAAAAYTSSGLGVETVQVNSRTTNAVVWRRGDVLMVGSTTNGSQPGSVTSVLDVLQGFDSALVKSLTGVCADQSSTVEAALRSPYVERKKFFGNSENVKINRNRKAGLPRAERTKPGIAVAVPAPRIPLPYVADLPSPPVPAVTKGPTGLPAAKPFPVEPTAPVNGVQNSKEVQRKIEDPVGPGCGWAFTGQVPPNFDSDTASRDFNVSVAKANKAMTRSWNRWQRARGAYFEAYARYSRQAEAYKGYAAEVERVRAAWQTVETARANYYVALNSYNAAVQARADFKAEKQAAADDYAQKKAECAKPKPKPKPVKPSASPTPGAPSSSASPSPSPSPTPTLQCPPSRPAILDQAPPAVPESPVPAPEAQLR